VNERLHLARGVARRLAAGGRMPSALKAALKAPAILDADDRLGALAQISVPALLRDLGGTPLLVPAADGTEHDWQIGALEQALLCHVAATTGARLAFEIGTFDGGTTLAMARAMGPDAEVVTVDLPDDAFTATQSPGAFGAADVGRAFRTAPPDGRAVITQLRGDSTTIDLAAWRARCDLVLVDGAHDRHHGLVDSRRALELVRPGGWVFWDDVEPYWHGLVDGILTATEGRALTKVRRTSLAYLRG
jgi:predicted O-methyltransferase YrrM